MNYPQITPITQIQTDTTINREATTRSSGTALLESAKSADETLDLVIRVRCKVTKLFGIIA